MLKHDISSQECKNINVTRALLVFKIRMPDGGLESKRMEVSLEELKHNNNLDIVESLPDLFKSLSV